MCFSAPASFVVSGLLLPIGVYTVSLTLRNHRRYLALATFPLLFSVQQAFEGVLWTTLGNESDTGIYASAMGFLFFAYLLWPFFVPLAGGLLERNVIRRRLFAAIGVVGLLFGGSLYLPLWINADWLSVKIVGHSILYEPTLIYDEIVPRAGVRIFYAVIVTVPLLLSTVASLRTFGFLILASVIISTLFFMYASVSVWCFFAVLLSIYVLWILGDLGNVRGSPSRRTN